MPTPTTGCGRRKRWDEVGGSGAQDAPQTHVITRDQTAAQSPVPRVADGIPDQLDRLRGLGNAVVPQVAEWIGQRIVRKLGGSRFALI